MYTVTQSTTSTHANVDRDVLSSTISATLRFAFDLGEAVEHCAVFLLLLPALLDELLVD